MSKNLQSQSTVLTGARQTMAAWSKLIETREGIPAVYTAHFDKTFGGEQCFPLVIWTPALIRFPRNTTEKLVCGTDDALYIFEKKNGGQVDTTCYAYSDIYSSEVGNILLVTWLTVYGQTSEGEPAVSTVEFNTTSRRYFAPILSKLRPFKVLAGTQMTDEKEKFNRLSDINFKFMNYGRESLLPGETIIWFLLQPEIRQPLFTIFGKTFDTPLSFTNLTVLTDQELILIRDTASWNESRANSHEAIWQYIPLSTIRSVSCSDAENERVTLSLHCRPDRTLQILFDTSNLTELEQLCSHFNN
jgi:hypothetical protein